MHTREKFALLLAALLAALLFCSCALAELKYYTPLENWKGEAQVNSPIFRNTVSWDSGNWRYKSAYSGGLAACHGGLDLRASVGTTVRAVCDGKIIYAEPEKNSIGYGAGGNVITLLGDDGYYYYYAHLKSGYIVSVGDRVTGGQVIGYTGRSGGKNGVFYENAVDAHLHFQVCPPSYDDVADLYAYKDTVYVKQNNITQNLYTSKNVYVSKKPGGGAGSAVMIDPETFFFRKGLISSTTWSVLYDAYLSGKTPSVTWNTAIASNVTASGATFNYNIGLNNIAPYKIIELGLIINGSRAWSTSKPVYNGYTAKTVSGSVKASSLSVTLEPGKVYEYYFYVTTADNKTYTSNDGGNKPTYVLIENPRKPQSGTLTVTKDNANLRAGMYEISPSIGKLAKGTQLTVVGATTNSHYHTWYFVKNGSAYGWIYSENVKYVSYSAELKRTNKYFYVPVHESYYGSYAPPDEYIKGLQQGANVTVYDEICNSYGNVWYQIRPALGGTVCWVWGDYLLEPDSSCVECGVAGAIKYITADDEMGTNTNYAVKNVFDVAGATSYTVASGKTSIDGLTNASKMSTITIPTSVTSIEAGAFSGCSALKTVNYAGTTSQWNSVSIGANNACLTGATINCKGDGTSAASFSAVSATPTTTNAMLNATVKVTNGSGTFTGSGIRLYNSSGTLIASKDETHSYSRSASGTNSYNIWYDVTDELGKTLTANTTYSYQFYSVFNGTKIWSAKKSFTTKASSMKFTYTLKEVTQDSFTFAFKGTASTKGKFSEFGCKLIDLNTNTVKLDYVNTTDKNLNVANATWFSIDKWTLSGTSGHTYSMQLYYVFNGTKYSSSVYTITFPDNTKPTITNAAVSDPSGNGFTVSCTAKDNNELEWVKFKVWSQTSGESGAKYYTAVPSGTTYSHSVNINDHSGHTNCNYSIMPIAQDKNGNVTYGSTLTHYMDAEPPVITDLQLVSQTANSYKVTCTYTDNIGIDRAGNRTYVDYAEDARYSSSSTSTVKGGTYTFTIYTFRHQNKANCVYTTDVYVYDTTGNAATQTLYVYVDADAPSVTHFAVVDADDQGFTVNGIVTDNVGVTALDVVCTSLNGGGEVVHSVDTANAFVSERFTFEEMNHPYGPIAVSIRAQDAVGNAAEETMQVLLSGHLDEYRVLTLPSFLTEIGEEAFLGVDAEVVILSQNCQSVGSRAFADCAALKCVCAPEGAVIAEDAFEGNDAVIVTRLIQ